MAEHESASSRTQRLRQVAAFVLPAGLLSYYALRGGSYDIVAGQAEGLALWWVIGLGFLFGLLPIARPPRVTWVPLACIGLLAGWTALSLGWTESDEHTVAEIARVLHFMAILVLVWSVVDRTTWRAAAGGVVAAACGVSLLALLSRLAPDRFPTDFIARSFRADRLNYPFNYWNAVAAWGAMSMAMALAWSAHAQRLVTRALALAALPACALVTYITYSRAGVAGTGLALLAVLIFSRNRWTAALHALAGAGGAALAISAVRNQPAIAKATGTAGADAVALAVGAGALLCVAVVIMTWLVRLDRVRLPLLHARVALGAGLAALAVAGLVAGPSLASKAWDSFNESGPGGTQNDPASRLGSLSSNNRVHLWRASLDAFSTEPFHGIGAGSYEYWWSRSRRRARSFELDAHNLYVEQLGELGVPGAALTLALVLSLLAAALRARIRRLSTPADIGANVAMLSGFIVFLLHAGVDWMWETTAVTALAFVAVAVGAAGISTRMGALRLRWRIPVVALAVVAALVQVPGLVSTSRIRDSQAAFRSGDLPEAVADARDAIDAEPWAASPYVQAGLVAESEGRLGGATRDLRAAIRREPTNWRLRLLLARVQAERGNVRAALRAFRAARRLRPRSQFYAPR